MVECEKCKLPGKADKIYMDVIVRHMQEKDIQQVQQVAQTSWHDTYADIVSFEARDSFLQAAYNESVMQNRMENSFFYVAEVEEKIVGLANFTPVTEKGKTELIAIYLYPEQQGTGIGTALLDEGLHHIKGVKEVMVDVEKENEKGNTFYKAKGFEVSDEFEENFAGSILKTVRMVLKI